ncbi:MAG: hypothetical protein JW784_00505 [Candidatus Cloacimonetes bacterium]|nr:hypothetical protein [Candidatus Cloacimonadota bacterium]
MVITALFENIRNEAIISLFSIPDEAGTTTRISATKLENHDPGSKIRKNKLKFGCLLRYNRDEVTVISLEKTRLFPRISPSEKKLITLKK